NVPTAGTLLVDDRSFEVPTGDVRGRCTVFVRPERLKVVTPEAGTVTGVVDDVVFVGSTTHVKFLIDSRPLQVVVPNDGSSWVPAPGTAAGVDIPLDAIRLLPY